MRSTFISEHIASAPWSCHGSDRVQECSSWFRRTIWRNIWGSKADSGVRIDLSLTNLLSFFLAQLRNLNVCKCVDILGYLPWGMARCTIILASYETPSRVLVRHLLMKVSSKWPTMVLLWRYLWGTTLIGDRECRGDCVQELCTYEKIGCWCF
jgi:hypothetical protein